MSRIVRKNLSMQPEDAKLLDEMNFRLGLDGLKAGIPSSTMGTSWFVRALIAYAAERYASDPPTPGAISPFSAELLGALKRHAPPADEEDDEVDTDDGNYDD